MDDAKKYYMSGLRYAEACGDSMYVGKFAARLVRFQDTKKRTFEHKSAPAEIVLLF